MLRLSVHSFRFDGSTVYGELVASLKYQKEAILDGSSYFQLILLIASCTSHVEGTTKDIPLDLHHVTLLPGSNRRGNCIM